MTGGPVVAIVQARMGSTRLPGKALAGLGGQSVIDHVIRRVRGAQTVDRLVVATTDLPTDDVLVRHLVDVGVKVVRGSSQDVLSRFALAIEAFQAAWIVRVTADCPFIDSGVIDEVVAASCVPSCVDYCSNVLSRTYPIGMDCEVFTRDALLRANSEARSESDREHVTPYMYGHPGSFALRNVEAPSWARRPDLRLTIDESADLALAEMIVERLGDTPDLRSILELMDASPGLAEANRHVEHRHVPKPSEW